MKRALVLSVLALASIISNAAISKAETDMQDYIPRALESLYAVTDMTQPVDCAAATTAAEALKEEVTAQVETQQKGEFSNATAEKLDLARQILRVANVTIEKCVERGDI